MYLSCNTAVPGFPPGVQVKRLLDENVICTHASVAAGSGGTRLRVGHPFPVCLDGGGRIHHVARAE